MRPVLSLLLAASLSAGAAHAQTTAQRMSIEAGYGTVTMGGVQWQRFSFRPDIPIGNFGIGFDFELFIDETGKISDEGWDFSNSNRTWDTLVRKIYYVRYGQQLDPVYLRAGALDDVTLGYGLIMDRYRNTLTYPADKSLGVDFALRDIGTFGIGLHAMINNVGDFKNNGAIVGGRVSARPFKMSPGPLVSKLEFGLTVVRDINQFAGLKDSDDDGYPDFQDGFPDDSDRYADTDGDGFEDDIDIDVDGDNVLDTNDPSVDRRDYLDIQERRDGITVWGADVGMPLIDSDLRLDLYGQTAFFMTGNKDIDGGWGIGAPGLRLLFSDFRSQIEFRRFDGRFRPQYFNHLYDHDRVVKIGNSYITKEQTLPDEVLNGLYAAAGYTLLDLVSVDASYQHMTGDRTFEDVVGRARVGERLLQSVPKISLLEGYFYNTYVDRDRYGLFDETPGTMYGTRVGIELTPGMMIVWDNRYTFAENDRGGLDKQRFVSIETVISVR